MIKSEVFRVKNPFKFDGINEATEMVNNTIKRNGLTREDILEYRTDSSVEEVNGEAIYTYIVYLSWWVEPRPY